MGYIQRGQLGKIVNALKDDNVVNVINEHQDGYTPLLKAVEFGNENMVLILLSFSNINKSATIENNDCNALNLAASTGNEILVRLLFEAEFDPGTFDSKSHDSFHYLKQQNSLKIIQIFEESNVRTNNKHKFGQVLQLLNELIIENDWSANRLNEILSTIKTNDKKLDLMLMEKALRSI